MAPPSGSPTALGSDDSPRKEMSAGQDMPEWMSSELVAYNLLQEVSSEIVCNCEKFGRQLEGVCGQAKLKLPNGDASFDCFDACMSFISAYGALSNVFVQLASDVESSVQRPLQSIISSLTEERRGRMKHLKQVRGRFAELQERYRRSQRRSMECSRKLEKKENKGTSGGWLRRSTKGDEGDKAAAEQHAAMCDLAQCEEELRESEAFLRRLEEDNKEIIIQLDREKQAVLRGALNKGTGCLRRLVSVAERFVGVDPDGACPESPASEGFCSLMPCSRKSELEEAGADEGSQATDEAAKEAPIVPTPSPSSMEAEAPEVAADDPASKYLQGSGKTVAIDISELSESDGELEKDASARAAAWMSGSLTESPLVKTTPKRRSLVFQSRETIIARPDSSPTAPALPRRISKSGSLGDSSTLAAALGAPTEHPSVSAPTPLGRLGLREDFSNTPQEFAKPSSPSAGSSSQPMKAPSASAFTTVPLASASPSASSGAASSSMPSPGTKEEIKKTVSISSISSTPKTRPGIVDSSDDEESVTSSAPSKAAPKPPLEAPEMELEVIPLVAENAQKFFERYVRRLAEEMSSSAESNWEKLMKRSEEECLGGIVGKLEFFWLCCPGSAPTAETADGLVCFQFVQGFAANFARVLHLSVTRQGGDGTGDGHGREPWMSILPTAIFEVRRLIFSTLPVDSIRMVVLAGEDETSGRIYVDGDVEAAYERCRFRWFQLTQNLRRSRSGIRRKRKMKLSTRFLVLYAPRQETDPRAPHNSSIGRLPAVLFGQTVGSKSAVASESLAGGLPCSEPDDSAFYAQAATPSAPELAFTSW